MIRKITQGATGHRRLCAVLIIGSLWLGGCGDSGERGNPGAIHLTSGQAYLDQGQYRAAMIEARNAIRKSPGDSAGYLLLASIYNDLGDPGRAAELLRRSPDSRESAIALELAEAYLHQEKFRSAEETLKLISADDPSARPLRWHVLHAQALAGNGAVQPAMDILSGLLDANGGRHHVRLELARLQLIHGQGRQAEQELARIPPETPAFAEAQQLRAIAAYRAGDLETAERLLTDALGALPPSDVVTPLKARVLRQLSETLTQLGRPSEALIYNRLLAEAAPGMQERRQKFSQALELYRTGNLDEAEKLLTELYEVNPESDDSGLLLGLVRYQRGEYAAAGELFDQHIDPEINSPQLIEAAAMARLQQSRSQDALQLLDQALIDHPDDPSLLAIYGMTALRNPEQRDDGALALQKALALEPQRSRLRLALASYFLRTGKPEQALAQLQTAATDAPGDPHLQSAYINYLVAQGQIPRARGAVYRFMQSSEGSPAALVLKGQVEAYDGNHEEAEQAFASALEAAPEDVSANLGMAQLALRQQQWTKAAEYFHRAVQLTPESERPYKGLLTAYEAQGDRSGGVQALRELGGYSVHAPVAYAVLGEYHLRRRDLAAASQAVGKALAGGGHLPYVQRTAAAVYRAEGRAAQDAGDSNRARERLMAASELAPDNLGVLSDLVVVELAAGRQDEAGNIIDRIQRQPRGAIPATLMTAYAHQQSGDQAAAVAVLEAGWQKHAAPALAERLYRLLEQQHRYDDARRLAIEWSQRSPRDPRPPTYIAGTAQARGQLREAQRYYEQALALAEDTPALLNNLALVYFELGDERAAALARKAAELAPDNAAMLDTYGWILTRTGERSEGIRLLERAAAIDPESTAIAEHLARARRGR